jgi:hypothetical protein
MTGFQKSNSHKETLDNILKIFKSSKTLRFMQFSLRSATDIFKKGGDLTQKLSEKDFNLLFDNRREIIEEPDFNKQDTYFKTKPFKDVLTCKLAREIGGLHKNKFSTLDHINTNTGNKDSFKKICVRMIIRLLYQRPDILGLNSLSIDRKTCQEILQMLKIQVSLNYISQQKSKSFISNSVPSVEATRDLLNKLKEIFNDLNINKILRK